MTRVAVLGRLAVAQARDAWRHTTLSVAVLLVAATTLSLALVVQQQAQQPWQRLFDVAHGAHVTASAAQRSDLDRLSAHPDVAAASRPVREAFGSTTVQGRLLLLRLVEASAEPAVDRPVLTAGAPAGPGGVVVESTAAAALGLAVGDPLDVGPARAGAPGPPAVDGDAPRVTLRVAGTARVVSQAPFPGSQPALVVVAPADLDRVVQDAGTGWTVGLRLRDPEASAVVAAQAPPGVLVGTWQQERDAALDGVRSQQAVLGSFAVLLLLVAGCATAVLATGRALESRRRTALLQAIGVTPAEARAVVLLQHGGAALVAAVLGTGLAAVVAPRLTGGTAAVLRSNASAPSAGSTLLVVVVVVGVTLGAVVAAGRTSRRPRRTERRLLPGPYPVALGARLLGASAARTLLGVVTVALAVAAAVACAAMEATLAVEARGAGTAPAGFWPAADGQGLRPVAYGLLLLLALLGVATVAAATATDLAERAREDAALVAVGLSRLQLAARSASAAGLLALAGAAAGVPLGHVLFRAAYVAADGRGQDAVGAPASSTLLSVALVVSVVTVLATGMTALLRRRPVAPVLRTT